MSKEQARATAVLSKYISPTNVKVIVRQAFRDGMPVDTSSPTERAALLAQMERGLALFLTARDRDSALAELRVALSFEDPAQAKSVTFDVRLESDISLIRTEARRILESIGANGFAVQKVATIVSELARNMVSYAGGGSMVLAPLAAPSVGISIRAKDQGKGIPNLALIMSGNYRSRTGLGKGLLGCKRLADKFNISTDETGTRIEAEVRV